MKKMKIIIDDRELQSQVVKYLHKFGVETQIQRLDVADYIISDKIAVERKTGRDFADSLCDRRLFEQSIHLCNSYETPIMIIENYAGVLERNITPQSLHGAMLSLTLKFKITIVHTMSEYDTANMLKTLLKRQTNANKTFQIHSNKPCKTLSEQQEYIVASISGVGVVAARALLSHFKTVKNVMTASVDELQEVDGIGEKSAEKIKTILNSKYNNDNIYKKQKTV